MLERENCEAYRIKIYTIHNEILLSAIQLHTKQVCDHKSKNRSEYINTYAVLHTALYIYIYIYNNESLFNQHIGFCALFIVNHVTA